MQLEYLKPIRKDLTNTDYCRLMDVSDNGRYIATVNSLMSGIHDYDNEKKVIEVFDTKLDTSIGISAIHIENYEMTSLVISGDGNTLAIGILIEEDSKFISKIVVYILENFGIQDESFRQYIAEHIIDVNETETNKNNITIKHLSISNQGEVIAASIGNNKVSVFRNKYNVSKGQSEGYQELRDDLYFYSEYDRHIVTALSHTGDRLVASGTLPQNSKYKDSVGNQLASKQCVYVYAYNNRLKVYEEEAKLYDNEVNIRAFGMSLDISDNGLNIATTSLKFDDTGKYAVNMIYIYSKRNGKWKREIKATFNRNDLTNVSISDNGAKILLNRVDEKDTYVLFKSGLNNYSVNPLFNMESGEVPFKYNSFKAIMSSQGNSLVLLFNKDTSSNEESEAESNKDIILRELCSYPI